MADLLLPIIGVGTALVAVLVLLVIYSTWRKRKEGRLSPANYRLFFAMGLAWLIVGSALAAVSAFFGLPVLYAVPLFALGAIYLIVGLLNRDKWRD